MKLYIQHGVTYGATAELLTIFFIDSVILKCY